MKLLYFIVVETKLQKHIYYITEITGVYWKI